MARTILDIVSEDMGAAAPVAGQAPVATNLEESAALMAPYAEQGVLASLGWNKPINNIYQEVPVEGEGGFRTERVMVDVDPAFKQWLSDNNISASRGGTDGLTITFFKDGQQVGQQVEPRGRDLLGEYMGIVGGVAGGAVAQAIAPTIAGSLGVSSATANVIANAAVQATSQLATTGNIDPTSLALQAVSTVVAPQIGQAVAENVNEAYQTLTGSKLDRSTVNAIANAAGSAAGTAIKGGDTQDVLQNSLAGAVASELRDAGINPGVSRAIGVYISTGDVTNAIVSGAAREVASSASAEGRAAASQEAGVQPQTVTLADGSVVDIDEKGNIYLEKPDGRTSLIGKASDLPEGMTLQQFAEQKLIETPPVQPSTGAEQVTVTGDLSAQQQQIIDTIKAEQKAAETPVPTPQEKAIAAPQQIEVTAQAPANVAAADLVTQTAEAAKPLAPVTPEAAPTQAPAQQVTVTGERLPREIVDVLEAAGIDYGGVPVQQVEVTGQIPVEPAVQPQQVEIQGRREPEPSTEPQRVDVTGQLVRDIIDETPSLQRVDVTGTRPTEVVDEVQRVDVVGQRPQEVVDEVQRVEVTGERPKEVVDEVQRVEVTGEKPKEIVEEVSGERPVRELYTSVSPRRRTPSTLAQTLQAPSIGVGFTQGLGASRSPGEIESEVTGKRRKNVWNEASLRLKDALGL